MRSPSKVASSLLLISLTVCAKASEAPPSTRAFEDAVAGVDWSLVELGGRAAATGAGGRRATIRFEVAPPQASGFAGCNRFTARYAADGDSLRFEAAAMTRMACAQGMDLEQSFSDLLSTTRRYEVTGGDLLFIGPSGPVARFVRVAP